MILTKIRRKEFQVENSVEIEAFLHEMSYGVLGTADAEEGWPRLTPLNYVYTNGKLYFHGSRNGQKMRDLAASRKVTFCISKEYAIIPSYFTDPIIACPATAYFKSLLIYGYADAVTDLKEKAEALEALMKKLQPEGGYKPIDEQDELYTSRLKGVAVVGITIDSLTAKFKFGLNLKDSERQPIINGLLNRSSEWDEETVRLMELYCPAHRKTEPSSPDSDR